MSALLPQASVIDGPEADVIRILNRACDELNADETERLALFQAAIAASKLRADFADEDRLGVLGQNSFWGPAAARRDVYTSAEVFLREVRRLRGAGEAPRSTAKLAAKVQGGASVWQHKLAGRQAKRILAQNGNVEAVEIVPAVAPLAAEA